MDFGVRVSGRLSLPFPSYLGTGIWHLSTTLDRYRLLDTSAGRC